MAAAILTGANGGCRLALNPHDAISSLPAAARIKARRRQGVCPRTRPPENNPSAEMFNQPGFHRGHAAVEPNQEEQKRMQKVRVLAAAAALAALGATGGQALAASQVITLNATVASYCTSSGTGSETISLTSLVTSGFIAATPTNSTALNILCNNKTNVSLSSANGGLFDPAVTSAATGFQNRINYNATVTIGGASATVAATGATKAAIVGSTVATATAFSDTGDKVVITPVVNASPIMSGTGYTDTLTLSVIAQ